MAHYKIEFNLEFFQTYVFWLLLVKELIELQSSQSTYLRQCRNTPGLTKQHLDSMRFQNLSRYCCC